jgi:hypothetical protein
MSGGHFNYDQYKIAEMAEDILLLIENNDSTDQDDWGDDIGRHYPPEIIDRFKKAEATLLQAAKMVTRIDWLLSGDDGEDSFIRRWNEEGLSQTLQQGAV